MTSTKYSKPKTKNPKNPICTPALPNPQQFLYPTLESTFRCYLMINQPVTDGRFVAIYQATTQYDPTTQLHKAFIPTPTYWYEVELWISDTEHGRDVLTLIESIQGEYNQHWEWRPEHYEAHRPWDSGIKDIERAPDDFILFRVTEQGRTD